MTPLFSILRRLRMTIFMFEVTTPLRVVLNECENPKYQGVGVLLGLCITGIHFDEIGTQINLDVDKRSGPTWLPWFEISDATVRSYNKIVLKEDTPSRCFEGLSKLLIGEKSICKKQCDVTVVLKANPANGSTIKREEKRMRRIGFRAAYSRTAFEHRGCRYRPFWSHADNFPQRKKHKQHKSKHHLLSSKIHS